MIPATETLHNLRRSEDAKRTVYVWTTGAVFFPHSDVGVSLMVASDGVLDPVTVVVEGGGIHKTVT